MSDLTELRCFNPVTGKRDGGYCVWEGKGKCLKCEAAEHIEELEAENKLLKGKLKAAITEHVPEDNSTGG